MDLQSLLRMICVCFLIHVVNIKYYFEYLYPKFFTVTEFSISELPLHKLAFGTFVLLEKEFCHYNFFIPCMVFTM